MNMNLKQKSEYIDQMLTVDDVVTLYASPSKRIKNRIPCPIHHGTHNNFVMDKHTFYCFSCGASGNTIGFVQKMFDISFAEAVDRIDEDFALGMGGNVSPEKKAKIDRIIAEKQALEKAKKDALDKLQKDFVELSNELSGIEKDLRYIEDDLRYTLDTGFWFDLHSFISWAMGRRTTINYLLDETEKEIEKWKCK